MGRRVRFPGRTNNSVGHVPWESSGLLGTAGASMREGTLPDFTAGMALLVLPVLRAYAETYGPT